MRFNKTRFLFALPIFIGSLLLLQESDAPARPALPVSKPAIEKRLKFDNSRFMSENEIKYGQAGYALSVFHGTKIERFSVKMLGVLKKVNNGKDLILFRVTSGPSVTRRAMIVAGMSGSPVYINGKMVGAIAYGLNFAREPIGLITPIKDMLDSWDPDLPAKPGLSAAAEKKGLSQEAVLIDPSRLSPALSAGSSPDLPHGPMNFEPMMTPIAVAGLSPEVMASLSSKLAAYHFLPVAGSTMSGSMDLAPARQRAAAKGLTPGAAVGVSLAQGDVDMTAIGTLTYRDGDKIVAFGHPFTGIGPIDAAFTTAYITDIFPSYQESTKMGGPISTVGRVFQDRPFSVGAVIGQSPHMIPVAVTIDDQSDQRKVSFHARIINHPLLTGPLLLSVVNQAILQTHGTPGDAVAYVTTDVNAEEVGHIVRHNIFYDPLAINTTATDDLNDIVSMLNANPFHQLAVLSVNVSVAIQNRHATAEIDHIVAPRVTYQPGDTVQVGVVMRPFKQDLVVKQVLLTIPKDTPDGAIILSVRGGAVSNAPMFSIDANGGLSIHSGGAMDQPPPATVAQIVKQYIEQPKNNDLVATLSLPSAAPEINGFKLSLLPPTMASIMKTQHASALMLARDSVKTTQSMPWIVTGSQQLTINVLKRVNYDISTVESGNSSTTTTSSPGVTVSSPTSTSFSPPAQDNSLVNMDSNDFVSAMTPVSIGDVRIDDARSAAMNQTKSGQKTGPLAVTSPAPPIGAPDGQGATGVTGVTVNAKPVAPTVSVVRSASIWRQNSESAFDNGDLDGVAVTSAPDIRIAPDIQRLATTSASYVWSQAYDPKGNLYIGTGDDGLIYKIAPGQSLPTLLAHTHELEVTGLAYDASNGALYAATAPHGILFRIDATGKTSKLATLKEPYIPALLPDKSGETLYLATGGGSGKIYALSLTGDAPSVAPRLVFQSPDMHLLCLAQGPDGSLYAGGNPNGVVYKIDPNATDGKAQIVYDSPGPTVSAIAVDGSNHLYVGAAPQGAIYRVNLNNVDKYSAPQIATSVISRTSDFVSALTIDKSGDIWATAGDTIYRVTPAYSAPPVNIDDSVTQTATPKPQAATLKITSDFNAPDTIATFPSNPSVSYTTIAASPTGGVTAGTSSIAAVYGFVGARPGGVNGTRKGVYTSAIHDCRLKSRWGKLVWAADLPQNSGVTLETHTGDVAEPDNTWSDWSADYTDGSGSQITSPPARFIQYRALLSEPVSVGSPRSPQLRSVSLTYLAENRPPTVRILAPEGGDAVSGNINLRWSGSDPDKDTLEYEIYVSSDDGQTWRQLDTGPLRERAVPTLTFGTPTSASSAIGPSAITNAASAAAATRKPAQEPQIPEAVKRKMLQEATSGATPGGSGTTSAAPSTGGATNPLLRSQTFTWNTRQAPDGNYRIKVVASDAPSNAVGALTDEAISEPFLVVNTAPTLTVSQAFTTDTGTGQITMHGTASSSQVFIKAVQFKVDQDDWMAAAPDSGLYDAKESPFTIRFKPNAPGPHHVTVEIFDRAGNTALKTVITP